MCEKEKEEEEEVRKLEGFEGKLEWMITEKPREKNVCVICVVVIVAVVVVVVNGSSNS